MSAPIVSAMVVEGEGGLKPARNQNDETVVLPGDDARSRNRLSSVQVREMGARSCSLPEPAELSSTGLHFAADLGALRGPSFSFVTDEDRKPMCRIGERKPSQTQGTWLITNETAGSVPARRVSSQTLLCASIQRRLFLIPFCGWLTECLPLVTRVATCRGSNWNSRRTDMGNAMGNARNAAQRRFKPST